MQLNSRVEQAVDEVGLEPRAWFRVVLDIAVEAARDGGIPEIGFCGFSPGRGLIRLFPDPENSNLEQQPPVIVKCSRELELLRDTAMASPDYS